VETTECKEKKAFIEELKRQWKLLWIERIDDKLKAEGIASKDFYLLFVERGTVIMATKDYKPLDFRQLLQQHDLVHDESLVPSPSVGGWGKFAREIYGKKHGECRKRLFVKPECLGGQPKKGGRGWLHTRF
jgi:hypothetical protein